MCDADLKANCPGLCPFCGLGPEQHGPRGDGTNDPCPDLVATPAPAPIARHDLDYIRGKLLTDPRFVHRLYGGRTGRAGDSRTRAKTSRPTLDISPVRWSLRTQSRASCGSR
jgi:hypothetical protein